MPNKSNHGGQRKNAGRPTKSSTDKRQKTAITLRPDHAEMLQGKNRSLYIDTGLSISLYALGHPLGTEANLLVYQAINQAILRLEALRDLEPFDGDISQSIDPENGLYWTADHARLHKLLEEFWARIRQEPTFWEPER